MRPDHPIQASLTPSRSKLRYPSPIKGEGGGIAPRICQAYTASIKTALERALLAQPDLVGPIAAFALAWALVAFLPPILVLAIGWGAVLQWQGWRRRYRARVALAPVIPAKRR